MPWLCGHAYAMPMRGDPGNECNKSNADRCAACGKAHPAWSQSCHVRPREIQRIKIVQENTAIIYEGAETEISSQSENADHMEISDVERSKAFNKSRKRTSTDSSALTTKAKTKITTTPSSSLKEASDLQTRKNPRKATAGRTRSESPKKNSTPTPTANRTPLGERSYNMDIRHTPTSQLKQVSFSQDENDENRIQTQIPS